MTLLMRRLGREAARAILADRLPALPAELAGAQPITDVMFTYSSVGGTRIGDTELAELRGRVVDVARSHGYPDTAERLPELEAALARILRQSLPMTPNEASQEEAGSWTSQYGALGATRMSEGSSAT
jgi:hypothetical protein